MEAFSSLLFRTPGVAHVPPQKAAGHSCSAKAWLRPNQPSRFGMPFVRQSHHRSALRVTSGAVLTEPPRSRTSARCPQLPRLSRLHP